MFSYLRIMSVLSCVLCMLLSCTMTSQTPTAFKNESIVFIDKSLSVDFTASTEVKERVDRNIGLLLGKSFKNPGDKMHLYYIHAQTSSGGKLAGYYLPVPDCDGHISNIKKKHCQLTHVKKVEEDKQAITNALKDYIAKPNPGASGKYTQIHEVLDVASRTFKDGKRIRSIYLFSDMIHSCPKVELSRIPADLQKARDLAKKHAAEVRQRMNIQEANLSGVKVYVTTPDEALNPIKNKDILRGYWQTFFADFNMDLDMDW
jgi:hypothetical protein